MAKKRVLIVDDEEDLTWSISKHLSRDRDKYELIAMNSAMAALDVLAQVPVDLVITDIRMPEISGLDLLLKIRENYPQTKVVIMTAYGSSEIQEEANKRGCFKYIEKPFEIQELRQLIQNVIQEKKGFEGRISDFQLSDLIQLTCLGRQTNSIHFEKDDQRGVIYFEDGNIVHAQVDVIEGEEAFYEILTWEGGTFTLKKNDKAPKETIFKGWQSLLLEGLRRLDEKRAGSAITERDKPRSGQEQLKSIIEEFVELKGILMAAIFDKNGFSIASAIKNKEKKNYDIAELVPVISQLTSQGEETGNQLKLGATDEILVQFEKGILRIVRTPDQKHFFIALTNNEINISLLRIESKKMLKNIQTALTQL
ncbi:MAG: response regulator [Calditrichaeota bacterium]|nr:response regulator [Calditrichota bacterium]